MHYNSYYIARFFLHRDIYNREEMTLTPLGTEHSDNLPKSLQQRSALFNNNIIIIIALFNTYFLCILDMDHFLSIAIF